MPNNEDAGKDDEEEFWMNTCNSFVVQLAETQEKKKVCKTPVKRKLPKEQQPQLPKRKYTKRIKVEPVSESEQDKLPVLNENVTAVEVKLENLPLQENVDNGGKLIKLEPVDIDKENKTKKVDQEKPVDIIKKKEDEVVEKAKLKPKRNRLFKLKFQKPLIAKVKKIKKEDKKEVKIKKESKKEEKKETKKVEKKDTSKKEQLLQKKELMAAAKEEKKLLKKEEKRDLKKDQQDSNNKKDLNKKESKKSEVTRKKVAAEKENVTKANENTAKRSAAFAEAAGKINPRQSLRRKNSLKDYSFAFDELLDDAFAQFETEKIPVKKRRKFVSPTPSPAAVVATAATTPAATVTKKPKDKDSETIRMRLRSRNRPLLDKQEPQVLKKKKKKAIVKNIPKRRRKKSLGEKSAHSDSTANTVETAENWKDDLYKFKRSLRLPSKLISMVSPPAAGAVAPDQVSLTSIMNIPQPKPVKEPKVPKSASQPPETAAGKNKGKRLGHLFGRRDVFKGRHLLKREKIVSAEKLMQRNQRKKRQQEDVVKKGSSSKDAAGALLDDEDVLAEEDCDDDEDDVGVVNEKPPARVLFKRKFMRKKFRSGFDYIKKKKKNQPASEKKVCTANLPPPKHTPRYVSEIQAEIKGWIVNKGHGETVLHRAARLGAKVS